MGLWLLTTQCRSVPPSLYVPGSRHRLLFETYAAAAFLRADMCDFIFEPCPCLVEAVVDPRAPRICHRK